QAEDGIRDGHVTGVQTCALPILLPPVGDARNELGPRVYVSDTRQIIGTDTTYTSIRASPTGGNTVFTANLELRVPTPIFPERVQIGRASCRERVEIWGGGEWVEE